MGFDASEIPDQSGRTIVVTGGNSGLGYETVRALSARGAHVVMASRNLDKAHEAIARITREHPAAKLEARALDLASLESIRIFADALAASHPRLDVLVNNAGVMALPYRTTADGFEMQIGTNHLGHFALTGLLIERLMETPGSRVVTVSSQAHRTGRIDFEDLHGEKSYQRWLAYGQSKLANLLFGFELERRLRAAGSHVLSVAAHPGYAATNLQSAGAKMENSSLKERFFELGNRLLAQSGEQGALPQLYAATMPDVTSGDYYGPDGFFEMWGEPKRVGTTSRAKDRELARRLWERSERETGVRYPLPAA